jgi:two-component system response regulator HydG
MSDKLTILIVDDDYNMAKTLSDILKLKGYLVEIVHSGADALEKVSAVSFDCVLSDIRMPEMNGVELFKAIKAQQPDLLTVLMTAYSSDTLVQEGLAEGVLAVMAKPLNIALLLRFFSFLCKERSVIIVDDDPQFCKTLGDILQARGFAVTQITNPHEVLDRLGTETDREVVLLDMKLDGIGGLELFQEIRKRHAYLPVIVVTGYWAEMASAIEAALQISVYACLYKPFEVEHLLQLLDEICSQELRRMLRQPARKRK